MALDVIIYLRLEYKPQVQREADVAQVVAHLIGSEEVTGPSPVISFFEKKNPENIRILFLCTRGGKEMWPFARPRPGTASRGRAAPTRLYTRGREEYGR